MNKNHFIALGIGIILIVLLLLSTNNTPTTEVVEIPLVEEVVSQLPADIQQHIDSKKDLIVLDTPMPLELIESPVTITGSARGSWFFEATFPIVLTNWDGLIIAEGYATATDEWMTAEFVPFTATLTFVAPSAEEYSKNGFLILGKSNASGLPEHDDALEIPIQFK